MLFPIGTFVLGASLIASSIWLERRRRRALFGGSGGSGCHIDGVVWLAERIAAGNWMTSNAPSGHLRHRNWMSRLCVSRICFAFYLIECLLNKYALLNNVYNCVLPNSGNNSANNGCYYHRILIENHDIVQYCVCRFQNYERGLG